MNKQKIMRRFVLLMTVLFMIGSFALTSAAERDRPMLYVGGIPFGVRFFTDGILVVDYCDVKSEGSLRNPAREAGVRPGDCILKINEEKPQTAADLAAAIEKSNGALTLTLRRETREESVTLTPCRCDEDGRLRTGLWVRDSGAGIGTVTYVTEQNTFAGLGHGICDGRTGGLIPIARGSVMGVTIGGVTRGAPGAPGELRGHFSAGKLGTLCQNTVCGVYGAFAERPALHAGKLPIAFRDEVKNGAATIWCTLDDNVAREYRVELSAIRHDAKGNKCFTVKVKDAALLDRTGGIVQGMSGSPIIQDGKLVGAVTHVLIGDPTTGYGIFIENMLANLPAALT